MLFGVVAIFKVPVQMIPDLDPRIINVETRWPGATPQDIEKEIVIEQEDYLRTIPGLGSITSTIRTGRTDIELEFPHGVDINEMLIRVNNALSQVPSYPENVDEPKLTSGSFSSQPFLFFRLKTRAGFEDAVLATEQRDFLEDHIFTKIERIPGVERAMAWGGSRRQIKIYVDPNKLAEREISLLELRQAIRTRNRDVSGGDINSGKRRYLLRTVGRFETIREIEDLIIKQDGPVLTRLRDVGEVRLGNEEVRFYAYGEGAPSMTFALARQPGSNAIEVMDAVMAKIDELNESFLPKYGLEITLFTDDVRYVKAAIRVVAKNLMLGAMLATLVLFVFLRSTSATLIGALGIPVCTIACFLGLLVTGRTINVISLAGVAFAIGMTLDNNIVVLENIARHLAMGKSRIDAALDGVREVWPAVLASTLTTICVFLPIVFIQQEAGQLYSDIAIAISAAILMSMLFAVFAVPAMASRMLRIDAKDAPRTSRDPLRLRRALNRVIEWLLHDRVRQLAYSVSVVLIAFAVIRVLMPPAEYLPEGEEPKVFGRMFAPPGYNVDTMNEILVQINETLLDQLNADPAPYEAGEVTIPPIRVLTSYTNASSATVIAEVLDNAHTQSLLEAMSSEFSKHPGIIPFAARGSIFSDNRGGTRSINVDIVSSDLNQLFDAGYEAFNTAKAVFDKPQVRPQPSTVSLGQPLLEVLPDWERAAEAGIPAEELGYVIWAFSDGAFVDEFFLDDDKIDIYLYSSEGTITSPQDLEDLPIYSRSAGTVPLSSIANIETTVSTDTIRRVDGRRAITLSIIPPRDIPLEQGVDIVQRDLIEKLRSDPRFNDGVTLGISGASDTLNATRDALSSNFIISVVISYLVLVAIFSHWGYPLLILATVPIGIGGGIVGLWLLNVIGSTLPAIGVGKIQQPFDMITMLGFLVLIGTVVNNPILIVERTLSQLKAKQTSVKHAVIEAVNARFRPVMMSTITTVIGLSPLVLLPGAGTELYRGLGAIVLFGLLCSTIVTLTLVPAMLALILSLRGQPR